MVKAHESQARHKIEICSGDSNLHRGIGFLHVYDLLFAVPRAERMYAIETIRNYEQLQRRSVRAAFLFCFGNRITQIEKRRI